MLLYTCVKKQKWGRKVGIKKGKKCKETKRKKKKVIAKWALLAIK